jgi:hypothetical protein
MTIEMENEMRTLQEINQDIEKYPMPNTPTFGSSGLCNTPILMQWGVKLELWEQQVAPFEEEKKQLFESLDGKYRKTFWGKLGFKRPTMWGVE